MSPCRALRSRARTPAAWTHAVIRSQADSCLRCPETERKSIPARRKTLATSGTGHWPQ